MTNLKAIYELKIELEKLYLEAWQSGYHSFKEDNKQCKECGLLYSAFKEGIRVYGKSCCPMHIYRSNSFIGDYLDK